MIRRPRKKFTVNIPGINRVPESTTAVPNAPSSAQCDSQEENIISDKDIPAPANTSLDNENLNEQLKDVASIEKFNEPVESETVAPDQPVLTEPHHKKIPREMIPSNQSFQT